MNTFNTIFKAIIPLLLITLTLSLTGLDAGSAQSTLALESPTPPIKPQVSPAIKHDVSAPLREAAHPSGGIQTSVRAPQPHLPLPKGQNSPAPLPTKGDADPVLQSQPTLSTAPAPDFNFEGLSNWDNVALIGGGVLPPDTNGDVGPDHYVQWVNLSMAIWELDRVNSTATLVYGPAAGNAIWSGFGGPCETTNHGDPIVLYDHLADRWLISQFSVNGPYYECIAISQSGDPTGAWYRYAFHVSDDKMNDYPKFGVWPDGYYMTANQFLEINNFFYWGGAGVWAFERDKMLLGQTARMVYFDLEEVDLNYGGILPADLDGPPPPLGTPNYFAEVDDAAWIPPQDALRLWEFHVDWADPSNSTFGLSGDPDHTVGVAPFNPVCVSPSYVYDCVPQPGTSEGLDAIADRLMHRLVYRNFGDHAVLLANHTVDAGDGRAALRWYEVRKTTGDWSVHQQGTYAGSAPNAEYRWMGSAAMDGDGNIAVGYSTGSESLYPSIRYAGRLAGDPLNSLAQGETSLIEGNGSQTHSSSRWGDYSMLSVDPTDDCTFWYTNQYYSSTSSANWRTRIGSFSFPSCQAQETGALQGMVTSGGAPIEGASVQAGAFSTTTDSSGFYQMLDLPAGLYDVTAQDYGYQPVTAASLQVNPGQVTTQDFELALMPLIPVSGRVRDGSGQGWALYARMDISAPGFAETIFTTPLTGEYSLNLPQNTAHSFSVTAVSPGYQSANAVVTPSAPSTTRDFDLAVDTSACNAPGYDTDCQPVQPGGLIVGNVYDRNNGASLNGAALTQGTPPQNAGTTFPTPEDPTVGDGFYILFSPEGQQPITASNIYYGDQTQNVAVISNQVVSADFDLPAGRAEAVPASLSAQAAASEIITRHFTISNTGTFTLGFNLSEVSNPQNKPEPVGPFATPSRLVSPKHLYDLTATSVYEYNPHPAGILPGGTVIAAWDSGLVSPWGIGYDTQEQALLVGSVAAGGGDDMLYRYTPDGQRDTVHIDTASPASYFSADMTYNPFSRTLWAVEVGGENCIIEIDPLAGILTDRKICPSFDAPQRGLAYNPLNDTFYSGSWVNGILYHFDSQGRILASYGSGLSISGLAFNPGSGHLFALTNSDLGYDVYVLDAREDFPILGGFDVPGLDGFQQAGLAMDCNASLWVVNQVTGTVIQVESGENGACIFSDASWLDLEPLSGELAPGETLGITVALTAANALGGLNHAAIVISNDSPYGQLSVPVSFDVAPHLDFSVDPPSASKSGAPGRTVTYNVGIHNTGNLEDSYTIALSDNLWPVVAPAFAGPIPPKSSQVISVSVDIPDTAIPPDNDEVRLVISSNSQAALSKTAILTTNAQLVDMRIYYFPLLANR